MKTKFIYLIVCLILVFCAGCGETIRGMNKDAHRVGRGFRTIFVADE